MCLSYISSPSSLHLSSIICNSQLVYLVKPIRTCGPRSNPWGTPEEQRHTGDLLPSPAGCSHQSLPDTWTQTIEWFIHFRKSTSLLFHLVSGHCLILDSASMWTGFPHPNLCLDPDLAFCSPSWTCLQELRVSLFLVLNYYELLHNICPPACMSALESSAFVPGVLEHTRDTKRPASHMYDSRKYTHWSWSANRWTIWSCTKEPPHFTVHTTAMTQVQLMSKEYLQPFMTNVFTNWEVIVAKLVG